MSREEAIEIFKRLKENAPNEMHLETVGTAQELFSMAIQALSQEPCDDAISRDFQIGDEVRINGSDPTYDDCDVGWVIRNASEKVKTMYVMRNDGSADEECKAEWYKTGRHNAMLAEVIKALPSVTQKSIECDDAISREDVLAEITRFSTEEGASVECQQLYCDVNNMPSVTHKSGKWSHDGSHWKNRFICSECNYKLFDEPTNYCPNCGAKMVEPQERSGEE